MVRMEPISRGRERGSIDKTPIKRKRGRPGVDSAVAAAMGKVKSPAKAEANKTKAVGNKARTGMAHTPETKAKQRAASLGNTNSSGRVLSDEQKAAMQAGREAARQRKAQPNGNRNA